MEPITLGIVDDNPIYLQALEDFLSGMEQFQVILTAHGFQEYLEALDHEEPDMLLLDISVFMELREQIRHGFLNYASKTPILLMGLERPAEMEDYQKRHPALRFMAKDCGGDHIAERIISLMNYFDAYLCGEAD